MLRRTHRPGVSRRAFRGCTWSEWLVVKNIFLEAKSSSGKTSVRSDFQLHLGGMYSNVRVTTPAAACFFFRPRLSPGMRSTVKTAPSLPRSSSVLLSRPPPAMLPLPSITLAGAVGGGSARCLTGRDPLLMRTSGLGFLSPALSFHTCARGFPLSGRGLSYREVPQSCRT